MMTGNYMINGNDIKGGDGEGGNRNGEMVMVIMVVLQRASDGRHDREIWM